jgi:hypothetical protein
MIKTPTPIGKNIQELTLANIRVARSRVMFLIMFWKVELRP